MITYRQALEAVAVDLRKRAEVAGSGFGPKEATNAARLSLTWAAEAIEYALTMRPHEIRRELERMKGGSL